MGTSTVASIKRDRLERLRVRAEQLLRKSGTLHQAPQGSMLELLHEMSVYQTELEMQNEDLRRSQLALQESRRRYAELYDFAPVGYLTFDRQGLIDEVNLAGAQLLGIARRHVIRRGLHRFIAKESQQTFHQFCTRVFEAGGRETCVLRLNPKEGPPLDVHMAGTIVRTGDGAELCQAAIIDITAQKKAEEELKSSRKELQALASRLQIAHEAERTVLAQEIHDELSGTLTALKIDISLLPDRAANDQKLFLEKLRSMSALIDRTLARVCTIVTELRPVVLDEFGLVAAIEWQASEFQDRSGITCELHQPSHEIPMEPARSTAVFRILQEALTNVARHAQATRVVITLRRDVESLVLTVSDNGKGVDESSINSHSSLGLLGMRERAASLDGTTEVGRAPVLGTLVTVRIPIKNKQNKMGLD